jgi:excisionase family DNA binding protein
MQDLITPAEAARIRGVTRSAITDLMKRGRLNVVEVGGRSFLQRDEVEKFSPDITGRPPKAKETNGKKYVRAKK